MENIEKTRQEAREISNALNFIDKTKNDRLSYYSSLLLKEYISINKETMDKEHNASVDFCALTDKDEIKIDDKGRFVFKRDGQKAFNNAMKVILMEKVSVPTYVLPDSKRILELPMDIKLILNGILLKVDETLLDSE